MTKAKTQSKTQSKTNTQPKDTTKTRRLAIDSFIDSSTYLTKKQKTGSKGLIIPTLHCDSCKQTCKNFVLKKNTNENGCYRKHLVICMRCKVQNVKPIAKWVSQ
jgi:hypothetical protein